MKVGFTGTRDGMTAAQRESFMGFIEQLPTIEFHQGCCIGADADATSLMQHHTGAGVIGHPGDMPRFLSQEAVKGSRTVLPEKQPLDRNRDIVDACETLVACPRGPEERRSGTWSTVRYARKQKKRIVIIWPNGEVTEEGA